MTPILNHIEANDPLFLALTEFLSQIDQTLPANQNVTFYLSGGMLVYLYTGLERSYYIEGEFNRNVYIADGLSLTYTANTGHERLIRFNKNDSTRFNLMHPDYLSDAITVSFEGLHNMQVAALQAVDLCVSKIARLSTIDIDDLQTLVRMGYCTAQSIEQRAQEALDTYIGDLSHYRNNLRLAIQYAHKA